MVEKIFFLNERTKTFVSRRSVWKDKQFSQPTSTSFKLGTSSREENRTEQMANENEKLTATATKYEEETSATGSPTCSSNIAYVGVCACAVFSKW